MKIWLMLPCHHRGPHIGTEGNYLALALSLIQWLWKKHGAMRKYLCGNRPGRKQGLEHNEVKLGGGETPEKGAPNSFQLSCGTPWDEPPGAQLEVITIHNWFLCMRAHSSWSPLTPDRSLGKDVLPHAFHLVRGGRAWSEREEIVASGDILPVQER